MTGLKVGITLSSTYDEAGALLWSNGVHQNILYLGLLLARLPEVSLAVFVTCPDAAPDHVFGRIAGIGVLPLEEAIETLDILIELGVRAPSAQMHRFRKRGGRLISYMAGNALAMNFEAIASNLPHGEFLSEVPFDAAWITPQHWRMNQGYAVLTRSAQVEQVPHIWHPLTLLRSIGEARAGDYFWKARPFPEGWRLGVFDPNVNVLKTFHVPVLVIEEAYRRRPEFIRQASLFGADHLPTNQHFSEFCAATDIGRDGRLFVEARYPLVQILGPHVDAVVTHQWENELNYLYWDVLYSGRPLIHNARPLAEVGSYYEAFDPQDGGRVLCDALDRHAGQWASTRSAVLEHLWRYHIDNPAVQQRHSDLLTSVMDSR